MTDRPCVRQRDAVAWLQGELTEPGASAFEAHRRECRSCREFTEDASRVLDVLATSTAPATTAPRRARASWLHAAALVVLVCWAVLGRERLDPQAPDRTLALRVGHELSGFRIVEIPEQNTGSWLGRRLGADGTWGSELSTGLGGQEVGLHALGLLALCAHIDGGEVVSGSDGPRSEPVLEASRWLMARQDGKGAIGLPLHAGYADHAIATTALLEAAAITGRPEISRSAERAVAMLLSDAPWVGMAPMGGRNTPVLAWSLRALLATDERTRDEVGHERVDQAMQRMGRALHLDLGALATSKRPETDRLAGLCLGRGGPQSGLPQPAPASTSLGALYTASVVALASTDR